MSGIGAGLLNTAINPYFYCFYAHLTLFFWLFSAGRYFFPACSIRLTGPTRQAKSGNLSGKEAFTSVKSEAAG